MRNQIRVRNAYWSGDRTDGDTMIEADGVLVQRARNGDQHAYALLVTQHLPIARRTAAAIVGSTHAEDVVQEALVRVHGALDRLDTSRAFRPWLLRIVANQALDSLRATRRQEVLASRCAVLSPPGPVDSAEQDLLATERREALTVALAELPDRLRQVVVCRYLLELSEAETAEALGISKGTVKSRLSRALLRLRGVNRLERLARLLLPGCALPLDQSAATSSTTGDLPRTVLTSGLTAAVALGTLAVVVVAALSLTPPANPVTAPSVVVVATGPSPEPPTRITRVPKSTPPMPPVDGAAR